MPDLVNQGRIFLPLLSLCSDLSVKTYGFELEFNAKKAKAGYHEQIASINSFVELMREKMDILDVTSLPK